MTSVNGFLYLWGITVVLTYDDLSVRKSAIQSTTYPYYTDVYDAKNALDRNVMTCMRTRAIGQNSLDKTVWWNVDLGGVYIYSVNILFKNYDGLEMRQQGRFAGFSLFVSTTSNIDNTSPCYKDGPQLPPLNFTTTCITSGRYVIFYNERLGDVTYPTGFELSNVYMELCEVQVNGCVRPDVYGSHCNESCPTNCRKNTCHIQNGVCSECEPGWTGTTCNTTCSDGWYGQECKQYCSEHCRKNAVCNHVTGQCDGGCDAGWTGTLCDKVCDDGNYGYDCINNCSGNCLYGSSCNKQTGVCSRGCNPGYTDAFCSKRCVQSFGEKCRYSCSKHCLNNTCHEVNGNCVYGCEMGFYGDQCDKDICSHLKLEQTFSNSFWIYVGPVSFGINIFVTIGLILCIWGVYTKRLSVCLKRQSCAKSDLYAEAEVVPDENSHYQELGVSGVGNPYLNTTLN